MLGDQWNNFITVNEVLLEQNMEVFVFEARADLVVVDVDPEMADYDNPRGERYGFASYIRASNEYGDTFVYDVAVDRSEAVAMAPAEKLAAALNARMATGKLPVGFANWGHGRAVYGSQAYVDYGQAEDVELERIENELSF